MYASMMLVQNAKKSGNLTGTHQKLDRIARKLLVKNLKTSTYFPSADDILHFEGIKGPDGLKRKSPGVDEPPHLLIPDRDDGILWGLISNHKHNLEQALKENNHTRAAFEAAWLAHFVTDGLTPAHHFPIVEAAEELMTKKEFYKVFGIPIKGIMRGRSKAETLRNNWLYWGAGGYMNKHAAFEFGVAFTMDFLPNQLFTPKIPAQDFYNIDFKSEFYHSLKRIDNLSMYDRFRHHGWTKDIALDTKNILLPEIIRAIALAWASCIPDDAKKRLKNANH